MDLFSLIAALFTALLSGVFPIHTETTQAPAGYERCETEDAAGPCYWDATLEGNGQGRSFTVLEDGTLEYWD